MQGTRSGPGGGAGAALRPREPGVRRGRITEAEGVFGAQRDARLCSWPELRRLPLGSAKNSPAARRGSLRRRRAGSGRPARGARDGGMGCGARGAGSPPASAARPESRARNFLCPRAAGRARGGRTRAIYRRAASGWGWLPGAGEKRGETPGDPDGAAPAWRPRGRRGARGSCLPAAEAAGSVCARRGAPAPRRPRPRARPPAPGPGRGGGCGSPRPSPAWAPPRAPRALPA